MVALRHCSWLVHQTTSLLFSKQPPSLDAAWCKMSQQRGAWMVGLLSLSVAALVFPVAVMPLRTRELKDPSEAPQPGFKKKGGGACKNSCCLLMLFTRVAEQVQSLPGVLPGPMIMQACGRALMR